MKLSKGEKSEADWEEEVVTAGRAAARAWFKYVGTVRRALVVAVAAEKAGVTGARRLLPSTVLKAGVRSKRFVRATREPVARGIVSEGERRRLVYG